MGLAPLFVRDHHSGLQKCHDDGEYGARIADDHECEPECDWYLSHVIRDTTPVGIRVAGGLSASGYYFLVHKPAQDALASADKKKKTKKKKDKKKKVAAADEEAAGDEKAEDEAEGSEPVAAATAAKTPSKKRKTAKTKAS